MTSFEFDIVRACSNRLGEGPLVSCRHAWNHPETFHPRYGKFNLCNFDFDEKNPF